jgi:asparagine synthase (glutamine-hydrolysing)
MCGIAGCISFHNRITDHDIQKLSIINDGLIHRGPDSGGIYHDDNVALAHRRLSIIDLSSQANQPMSSNDGEVTIVFNGEIYNFEEIRRELEKEYSFRTNNSDTETIIYAYKKWGIESIQRFRGMFAIALYDKQKRCAYLIRDRLGKKPLYYCLAQNKVWFASEIFPLFNANVIQKRINDEAIYHYLSLFTVNAPATFFKDVYKLEAGQYMRIDQTGTKYIEYWNVSDAINTYTDVSFEEAVSTTKELLEQSMKLRNVSDVPISIALSGGIDSSLNLHYSALINKNNISAINVAYHKDNKYNENKLAEKLCQHYGIPLDVIHITPENLKESLHEYLGIQKDMPFGDMNTALMYIISKHARSKGHKVLLVGEGGDELGGYPIYSRINAEKRILELIPFAEHIKKLVPYRYKYMIDYIYKGTVIPRRNIHGFMEVLKKDFWNKQFYDNNSYDVMLKYTNQINNNYEDNFLRKLLNLEYKLRLPEMLLPRIDYPTMACGVEARSPYLDHRLVEYSAGLDFSLKMKYGAKSVLKQIARDELPFDIAGLPKVGFGMLMNEFINNDLPALFDKECNTLSAPIQEYINTKELMRVFDRIGLKNKPKPKLWILYALNSWLKEVL